jgi:glycosyltransferase involved in cell wall biosynthesis
MAPLVSIVMPCFNAGRWLGAALDSLQRQTLREIEIVAVDDASTDGTPALLADRARADPRIRPVRLERNAGPGTAANRGVAEARGAFIARLDADDEALPQRLEVQLGFLRQTGVDLCGSWFVEFGRGITRAVRWPHAEAAVKAGLLFQNPICHPTLMARREVFERHPYAPDSRLAEDYDLLSRASTEFRLASVPRVLVRYRRHPAQASEAGRDAMEAVTRSIRLANLARQGISATPGEQRLHNLIRAPASITSLDDLRGIERWLGKLLAAHADPDARQVIASQWIRACIRAAPLGRAMWRAFRASPLREAAGGGGGADVDLRILAALKLDYRGRAFSALRRLGLSA